MAESTSSSRTELKTDFLMLGIELGLGLLRLEQITASAVDAARYHAAALDAYDAAVSLLGVLKVRPGDRATLLHRLADLEMCLRLRKTSHSPTANQKTDSSSYSNLFAV